MLSYIRTVIASLLIAYFIDKSFYFVNSQTIPHNADFLNNTVTNSSKNKTYDAFDNCTEAFEVYVEKITNLTRCTLLNARPIRICMGCEEEMIATKKMYENLQAELSCKKLYFESDQIGITSLIYEQVPSLWSRNNCQSCYNNINQTEEFVETSSNFDSCMKQYNETETEVNNTCTMCLQYFVKLNDIYKDFVNNITEGNTGICMDIVDRMNMTRLAWNNLKCLYFDSYVGFPIIITTVLVGIVPVLFYLLSKNVSIIEDVKLVRPKRKSYASLQDSMPRENEAS